VKEYHKIQTVFLRDPATRFKTLLEGQCAWPEFDYLFNNEWAFDEKVDGTNIRVMVHSASAGGQIEFGGKTDNASIPAPLIKRLEEIFLPQSQALVEAFPEGACLYGEGYGARIQKGGGNYRPDQDFIMFDVKVGEWWLQRESVTEIAHGFGLRVVPSVGTGTMADMVERVRRGFNSAWGPFPAEGIVARPVCELRTRSGHRIITKLKTRDFLGVA
jgi:ATP-dependent RNA circularization protein (DNA/RNA ligase family)